MKSGGGIHMYACTANMGDKVMYNSDGDFLIVPQLGRLHIRTEMGTIDAEPCEIVVIQARRRCGPQPPARSATAHTAPLPAPQRGIKFSVSLPDGEARGYIFELFKGHFKLPDLGPIGALLPSSSSLSLPLCDTALTGLHPRHRRQWAGQPARLPHPHRQLRGPRRHLHHHQQGTRGSAEGEKPARLGPVLMPCCRVCLCCQFGGRLFKGTQGYSPFNVVAWHGNYAPYKYDLRLFNCMNSVTYDHPVR